MDVLKQYRAIDMSSLSLDRLSTLIAELTQAGEILDTALAAARTARRARVQ